MAIWAMAGLLAVAPSCTGIETEREAGPEVTLGDDIYSLMCDRLGASSLSEDLLGASYREICHSDRNGNYGDTVDETVLPPVKGDAPIRARSLSIAKMETMARHRPKLIQAFNAAFPDVVIPNLATESMQDTIALRDALLRFSQDITVLYETNPFESDAEPIVPMMTDAFGRLFGAIEEDDAARSALMSMAGRQGYRPYKLGLGAIRTLLGYPSLRPFIKAQLEVIGPDGSATAELQQMLDVVKRELLTSYPLVTTLEPYGVGPGAQPNRPRTALEVGAALLLDEHPDYLGLSGDDSRFITRRDSRGFAVPDGNTPGVAGTVPAPFIDIDGDGYADVDALGQFIVSAPLASPTPFFIPGQVDAPPVDGDGLPEGTPFSYLNTSQTLMAALARTTLKLVDPLQHASAGNDQPWLEEHEALMYALSGLQLLAGPREPAQFDHVTEQIVPAGQPCDNCSEYLRFVAEQSPLPDLIHAAGQVLAHPDSDVILLGLLELLKEQNRPVVARMLGAALTVKEIADAHDDLAATGAIPEASLAYEVPVWDEMAQVVHRMVQHPGLIAELLVALADPSVVESHAQHGKITGPPSAHLGETLSAFMRFRDRYTYDPQDINGPAYNITDGYPSFANPHNEVDRSQPLNGDNRSMFEGAVQMIYDGTRVTGCNKDGARVYTGLSIAEYWPLFGSYGECELFTFDNVGAFYLDTQLPSDHPKRAELVIKDGELDALLNFLGIFVSKDAFMETASGLDGLTLHPDAPALHRLLFFGADSDEYGQLPDYDSANADTDTAKFIDSALEPLAGQVCPVNNNGVNKCGANGAQDLLRLRDRGAIFGWERLGFFGYLQPQLIAFANVDCPGGVAGASCDTTGDTGENMFLDLVGTLWRHWPDSDAGSYCALGGSDSNPRYCSGAGINHYEPILADALETDLIPALHELAVVVSGIDITHQRGPKAGTSINGTEIIELIVKIMFDQTLAASAGVVDRQGSATGQWVDGTPQAQLTPYNLFADALHRMDATFDQSNDELAARRKSQWKRARSLLVDAFLAVEGEQNNARFKNVATPQALVTAIELLREQLNANCPDRESTASCSWARQQLGQKVSDVLSRPVFATMQDLLDKINANDDARRELEWFLTYALTPSSEQDAFDNLLGSLTDLMQLLVVDDDLSPIFNVASTAANPGSDLAGPGCADRTIQVLAAMTGDEYDRYHVLDYVLPALVTPMNDGGDITPVEVFLDAIADIHRVEAGQDTPLNDEDYLFVMQTVREFFVSETRGLQQLYYMVQNRPR